jgi:hypothetical protein
VTGLAPGPYWLDSSELAAAAWTLGVAHPPGHALPSLLGKAMTLLPLGTVALKVGLASSLAGALAAAQTAALARDVARRLRVELGGTAARADELLGAAAGLLFAGSYAAAFQAVRPEVYALSTLLVISTVRGCERFDATGDRRQLYLAALWAGLALTNHHLLALAALTPAVAALLIGRKREPRLAGAVARVLVGGALGLALVAYLPLRASRHPLVDWGAPTSWARVFWTVSAKAFQKSVATRGTPADLPAVAAALTVELRFFGALLALAGAYVMLRLPRLRRVALALLLGALADAAMPALVGFDPVNPDAYGYLEAAVALLAVLAVGLPVALLERARSSTLASSAAGTLAGASLLAMVLAWPRSSLASDWEAQRTLSRFWSSAPARAAVVTSDFQTVFASWYLRAVEGTRADCELVHRHFLSYPGYRDEILRASPHLAPLLAERDLVPTPPAWPLLVEYDLDLPDPWVARSQPVDAEASDNPQAARYAAWQSFLAAHRACRLHDAPLTTRALAHARAIIGSHSRELDELEAACR